MSTPTKEFERMANLKMIDHRNNPVLRWELSNVVLKRMDEYIKPYKEKSADKIDGVYASIMAIAEWMTYYGYGGGSMEIKTIGHE